MKSSFNLTYLAFFTNTGLFPDIISLATLTATAIGDQPLIGMHQAFVDQAPLLCQLEGLFCSSFMQDWLEVQLAPATRKLVSHHIVHFELLPSDFISGWNRASCNRLIINFYLNVLSPVEQLLYLYKTTPCSVTWRPSLYFSNPYNFMEDPRLGDYWAQFSSTFHGWIPFFDNVINLNDWEELQRIYAWERKLTGGNRAEHVNLYWLNAQGTLYIPELLTISDYQAFVQNAPRWWGLETHRRSFFQYQPTRDRPGLNGFVPFETLLDDNMILHTYLNTDSRILDDRLQLVYTALDERLSYYQVYRPELYDEKKAFFDDLKRDAVALNKKLKLERLRANRGLAWKSYTNRTHGGDWCRDLLDNLTLRRKRVRIKKNY